MSLQNILSKSSLGTTSFDSGGGISTSKKIIMPGNEVFAALSQARVSNFHTALFFVNNGFEEYKYDLIAPLALECHRLWLLKGWKQFKLKDTNISFATLVAEAIIHEYLSGNKAVRENRKVVLDSRGNAVTEKIRFNYYTLSKIYLIDDKTIKANGYLENHNWLCGHFEFICNEVARKVLLKLN